MLNIFFPTAAGGSFIEKHHRCALMKPKRQSDCWFPQKVKPDHHVDSGEETFLTALSVHESHAALKRSAREPIPHSEN